MDRRRLLAVRCAALVGWSLMIGGMAAQEPEPAPGELVLANGPEQTLSGVIAPASGALFVVGRDAQQGLRLLRSDDAGATWRTVPLPPSRVDTPRPEVVAIDPTNHATLYATGAEGLYKSDDDAASWRPLRQAGESDIAIAVSPADPQLVYLGLRTASTLGLHLSQDGGASWEEVYVSAWAVSRCQGGLLLAPHPTDPDRVMANVNCEDRRAGDLFQSRDRGKTWHEMLLQGERNDHGHPIALVGGSGAAPGRWYAGFAGHYVRNPGFHLDLPIYRSDDDGQTWQQRVIVPLQVSGPKSQERNPNVLMTMATDPAAPDRVYVGLKTASYRPTPPLQVSNDGGTTWKPLDVGEARDVLGVALGVDRQHLYAVTEQGLYRVRLR